MKLDLTIERYVGFFWVTVPCISDVGSCTYDDACALLSGAFGADGTQCPQQLVDNNVPCACPFQAGSYSMTNAVFSIPELSGLWSWLAEGDYRATAKLIDSQSGQELACQHMEVTVVDGHERCSGFLCSIFG
ncbi:hypothetical protein BaRGS_00022154 [Batillaria attramentaria]|uniref:MD-2-related lipid-recognition domain-containing protein n=1 Tax=Batillaria attramentaria TaxID=370345 RepID=A0ABD0KHJ4_9CAEN